VNLVEGKEEGLNDDSFSPLLLKLKKRLVPEERLELS
jgi:hypothetical protein